MKNKYLCFRMSFRSENQLQKEIQRLQKEDQGIGGLDIFPKKIIFWKFSRIFHELFFYEILELIKSLSNEVVKLQRDELAIRAAILKRDKERNTAPEENDGNRWSCIYFLLFTAILFHKINLFENFIWLFVLIAGSKVLVRISCSNFDPSFWSKF